MLCRACTPKALLHYAGSLHVQQRKGLLLLWQAPASCKGCCSQGPVCAIGRAVSAAVASAPHVAHCLAQLAGEEVAGASSARSLAAIYTSPHCALHTHL